MIFEHLPLQVLFTYINLFLIRILWIYYNNPSNLGNRGIKRLINLSTNKWQSWQSSQEASTLNTCSGGLNARCTAYVQETERFPLPNFSESHKDEKCCLEISLISRSEILF